MEAGKSPELVDDLLMLLTSSDQRLSNYKQALELVSFPSIQLQKLRDECGDGTMEFYQRAYVCLIKEVERVNAISQAALMGKQITPQSGMF